MPVKRHWTQADYVNLRAWCAEGISYTEQGVRFGVHRDTVAVVARRIGLSIAKDDPITEPKIRRALTAGIGGGDGEPLAAGHPISWGAITRGTWLEGTTYPAK